MSATGIFHGGVERIKCYKVATTSQTTLVEGTKNNIIASISIVNEHSNAVLVEFYYNDGTDSFMIWNKSIPKNETVIISELPIRLYEGDSFDVKVAQANKVTVTPIIVRAHPNERS